MPELQFRRPSPRLLVARLLGLCVYGSVLIIAVLVLAAGSNAPLLPYVIGCAVGAALLIWLQIGRYRAWGFAERADELVVRRGMFVRRVTVVPYGRMQFVDVIAGPIDRVLGIASVQMHTAASVHPHIPGLLLADAEVLRDRLAAIGEAQSMGL